MQINREVRFERLYAVKTTHANKWKGINVAEYLHHSVLEQVCSTQLSSRDGVCMLADQQQYAADLLLLTKSMTAFISSKVGT